MTYALAYIWNNTKTASAILWCFALYLKKNLAWNVNTNVQFNYLSVHWKIITFEKKLITISCTFSLWIFMSFISLLADSIIEYYLRASLGMELNAAKLRCSFAQKYETRTIASYNDICTSYAWNNTQPAWANFQCFALYSKEI